MASGRDLADQLLRRASDDEAAARAMLPIKSVTDAIVGFHAQQAVEKSLKAVLAVHGEDSPFIHDIDGLADLCEEAGSKLPDGLVGIDALTPYAVGLRYDDEQSGSVTREEALAWAAVAVEWARDRVENVTAATDENHDDGASAR